MRKFLLASHAYLAKGMKSSLELILGEQECVDVLCAYTDEQYDIKVEIEKKLTALQPEDELIVITDLFGGSVNNEFTSLLTNTDKISAAVLRQFHALFSEPPAVGSLSCFPLPA